MEVFNGQICVTGAEVKRVIPEGSFWNLINRGKISNIAGKACYGNPALYPVDGFPHNYKTMLYEAYPELSDQKTREEMISEQNAILRNILPDPKARKFFAEYEKLPGIHLSAQEQEKYENTAMILNALQRVHELSYSRHAAAGKSSQFREMDFWQRQSKIMPAVTDKYIHALPWNYRGLQAAFKSYVGNNYASLISKKIGNQNRTKKQRSLIEKIVISIYGSKEKPFKTDVTRIYNEFILGVREIYNEETCELFNRADFYRNGEPDTISDGLVWSILENPLNRKIVDRKRNDFHYNQNKHNAAVDREVPYFSLSKISMDDRDLVRKCVITKKNKHTGKEEKIYASVHAYYAYDVASGCIIGSAYSLKKDTNLVYECFRNMWNNLRTWGLHTPAECEVENHLMKGTEIEGKLERTFMYTTFCAPMNSREKRAEHGIKAKKYYGEYSEVKREMAKGRHYAKHEAYLSTQEKVFDEIQASIRAISTKVSTTSDLPKI
ncbi:MAG: hypothetical protein LBM07_02190 [Culturomica sp.]|jgi:hypothetical protein|nr:hypothetical protein [Culturomica sp.]